MRHFAQLDPVSRKELFDREPEEFDADSEMPLLAEALGATLYMPGTRPELAASVRRCARIGIRSVVIDLEDAVEDGRVADALEQALRCLDDLATTGVDALVFIRVRSVAQVEEVTARSGDIDLRCLTGFVLPKFSPDSGPAYLASVRASGVALSRRILAMPVLETPDVIFQESRVTALGRIHTLLLENRDIILGVRLGATDLCGLFGIRRDRDLTIYDVRVVADFISDTVNRLARAGAESFSISGPVWEYYANHERIFRPQLRQTPFVEHDANLLRHRLLTKNFDDLIREVVLDRVNGLHGKTVIHPSHAAPVHALSVVSFEEFSDADDILRIGTGVKASEYRDKMNEARPHRWWAEQIMLRARVFGVASPDTSFVDLLAAMGEA